MADKVQNIVINYKVNTAEVERAKNLSQQAQQATDKFHQSAQQGAAKSAQGLSTLTAEQTRLENAIKNTNRSAFTSYAAYTKQLQNLSRQYSDVKIKVDQANKSLNEQKRIQDELNKSAGSLAKTMGALGTTILSVFSVAALKQAVSITLEMARLSGNVEGVERAFRRAIPNSVFLLDQLRKSTQGTITDFDLMKQALQAKNFGLPVQQLGKLLEFATVKAQQTGLSIDYITNSLVTGLGRKSERVFDNLQLDIAELRKRIASGLDFREAGIQLVIEDLERMGGSIKTSATLVDQLTTKIEELKIATSQKATEGGGGGLIGLTSEAIENLTIAVKALPVDKLKAVINPFSDSNPFDAMRDVGDFYAFWQAGIQKVAREEYVLELAIGAVEQVQGKLKGTTEERVKLIQDEINERAMLIIQYNYAIANLLDEQDLLKKNDPYNDRIDVIDKFITSYQRSGEVVNKTIELLVKEIAALKELADTANDLGLIEAKLKEIEEKADAIKTAKSTQEIHDLNIELEKLNAELADLKAFGTTKRQLIVEGQLKLVPVIAPKGESKTVAAKGTDMTKQLQELVDNMIVTGVINFKTGDFNISQPNKPVEIIPMTEWERIAEEFEKNWRGILGQGVDDTANFLSAVVDQEAAAYEQRIEQSRQYYDRLMVLAGDNEKQKDRLRLREQKEENKLRREAFEAEKRAQMGKAAINGAAAIVKTYAELGYPAGIPAVLLLIASTAAQIATISAQKPRFAKGVIDLQGPGTKTSDSIDARLSKGESVMTADETFSSKGILKAVRAKTLNDKILKDLKLSATGVVYNGGMSDERIVKGLEDVKNSIPDYAEKHGLLYKTKKKSENYKLWVRNKSF